MRPRPSARLLLDRIVLPMQAFFRLEAASGVLLLACAVVAMFLANSAAAPRYQQLQSALHGVVNDGLMILFFFVVGMEIKRELVHGELRTPARALLPAIAALGGMVVPAGIYLAFNHSGPGAAGWGIPMATDIAFSIGCLTLLKRRVSHGLAVFLTALAIFDDLGGIVVIALFYGRAGDSWLPVHPTLLGVFAGLLLVPRSQLDRLIRWLHPWVAFGVMPIFALVNAGVVLGGVSDALSPVAVGTALGLFVGKQVGVFVATLIPTALRWAPRPGGASLAKIYGVSVVAGIGFTVALFIASLAFAHEPALLAQAKLGVLVGSLASGLAGAAVLRATSAPPSPSPDPPAAAT